MAEVLLMPFTKKCLNINDSILNYTLAYRDLTDKAHNGDINEHNRNKKAYKKSFDELLEIFENDYRWEHYDDIIQHINMFYPGYKLVKYLEGNKDIGRFYFNHIMEIARTFITFRDGDVAIRYWSKDDDPLINYYNEYDKIDLWNQMTRTANIDLFIAAACINFNVDIDNMYNIPNLVSMADMPLRKILKKGVAETHLHAKAGISYQDIWKQKLFETNKKDPEMWFCTFFRLIVSRYLNGDNGRSFEDRVFNEYGKSNMIGWFADYINGKRYLPGLEVKDSFISLINKAKEHKDTDFSLDYLYFDEYSDYRYKSTSADIILYYFILKKLKDSYDPFLCKCFLEYVRNKNCFFEDKIQRTIFKGLNYFQKFYDKATKIDNEELRTQYYYSVFEEQCKTGNLEYIEIKISPPDIRNYQDNEASNYKLKWKILKQVQCLTKAYSQYIRTHSEKSCHADTSFKFPKLGIIYHFIKKEDSDNFSGYSCSFNYSASIFECSDYNAMRKKNICFLNALSQLMKKYPVLTDYIVGIDAASIENATEPWVFAPVFRAARRSTNTIPYSYEKKGKIQTLGFTYHVGEDFRHIASGLRHIDEVLDHFDYRSGDRLGHATALGVDIDYIASKSGMVSIPIVEHLENLLWMWHYVKENNTVHMPENLEFKILETARRIYGDELDGINVYMLWRVYQAKFEDIDKYKFSQDDCKFSKTSDIIIKNKNKAWIFSELLFTHYCPCFYEIYHRPIFISAKENIQFCKELQKKMLHKIENMGIYIETNPSSNAIIGDLASIMEHPILRLNKHKIISSDGFDSRVLVTINSDDPIIFSTNVENEIAYIYYSLLRANCGRENALEWIDKIRCHGLNSTFIKSEKNIDEMILDFDAISDICEV